MRLEFKGLTKQFEDHRAVLSEIDFDREIHHLAVIGSSGCGKSTLLRIIGGLLPPTAGTVLVDGAPLPTQEKDLVEYRKRLGFVFQQGGLFRHMTALENVARPLVLVHGLSPDEAERRAKALLARFGLGQDGEKRPAQLSGGQQQRVAIARAVAPGPKLILLDEPTSALDPEYTTEVLDILKELKDDGVDFIVVTHEMGFAQRACDDAAFLYRGKLLEYGPSKALFNHPASPELRHFLARLLEWNVE